MMTPTIRKRNGWGWGANDTPEPPFPAELGHHDATILDEIIEATVTDLAETSRRLPLDTLRRVAAAQGRPPSFLEALTQGPHGTPRVIAEIKRASPSKGLIRGDFGVISLSRELEDAGAAALSVLTEPRYFLGSPRFLQAVAASARIPTLRKDFIVDPYQLYEAKAWGAAAVLLIAAALTPTHFTRLLNLARDLELDVLAEVHSTDEMHTVLEAGADIVGVNSRNLKTFETDLDLAETLLGMVPDYAVGVAESGIRNGADMRRLMNVGAEAFLIGETLMKAESPGAALAQLLQEAAP